MGSGANMLIGVGSADMGKRAVIIQAMVRYCRHKLHFLKMRLDRFLLMLHKLFLICSSLLFELQTQAWILALLLCSGSGFILN